MRTMKVIHKPISTAAVWTALQQLTQKLPRVQLIWTPLPARAATGQHRVRRLASGDLTISIRGSANHSTIYAIRTLRIELGQQVVLSALIVVALMLALLLQGRNQLSQLNRLVHQQGKPLIRGNELALDIAVLPFSVVDASPQCAEIAEDIGASLAEKIRRSLASLDFPVNLWTPQQIDWTSPREFARIDEGVAAFAKERGVEVAIYGTVTCAPSHTSVATNFYTSLGGFGYVPELVGALALSPAVEPARMDAHVNLNVFERDIDEKAQILARIASGLWLYTENAPAHYQTVAELFEQALKFAGSDPQAKGILHYLLGSAYLSAILNTCDRRVDFEALQSARKHLEQAILEWPEFAPAYLARGSIALITALQTYSGAVSGQADSLLEEAKSWLERAARAPFKPDAAYFEHRIALMRARIAIAEHDISSLPLESSTLISSAESYLSSVLANDVTMPRDELLAELLAQAHTMAGHLSNMRQEVDAAIEHYTRTMQLAKRNIELRSESAANLAEILSQRNRACEAARYFELSTQTSCPERQSKYVLDARDLQLRCRLEGDQTVMH